jgi:predicted N-formylglutamate amidohydrolase
VGWCLGNTTPESILGPHDPPPFRWEGAERSRRLLLVCDHAGRSFPCELNSLGLPVEARTRHIAWDIGAAKLTAALGEKLSAPTLLATYSRLVADCNRDPASPTFCSTRGDGHRVPGNEGLTPEMIAARQGSIHTPYHEAIRDWLDRWGPSSPSALISIHSFTPVLNGRARPWTAGVLWDEDGRIAVPLLQALRASGAGRIGDNEPYSGHAPADYTLHRHAAPRGLPHVSLEIRQDELLAPTGVQRWASILTAALNPLLLQVGIKQ